MKVLTIEDDSDIRATISLVFELHLEGANVIEASDGGEGLRLIEDHNPDVVLLEPELVEADGLELCHHISTCFHIPVVILTASNCEEGMVQGLRAGADDYLTKPFRVTELVSRVEAVVRRRVPAASTEPTEGGMAAQDGLETLSHCAA